jgi:hypothetical protein
MELETDGIGGKPPAGQPRPLNCALAFFDPVLRRAALVVEGDDALGWTCQVGHDEADARIKLARLDFRYDLARLVPLP